MMTEQELREKIAKYLFDICRNCNTSGTEFYSQNPSQELVDTVEADCYREVSHILTLIKEAGYVKLADDQSLPEKPFYPDKSIYCETQQDMLKAGWRKVELNA